MKVNIKRLISLMCENQLNQKRLAENAGISEQTITAIMHNGTGHVETVGKLSKCFDCEPGELITM